MQLQKAIGNRATLQLLQARTIQRDVENETHNNEDNKAKAKEFFAAYDTAVDNAYKYVLSVPHLGAFAKLNGHTELWVTKWNQYLKNEKVDLMAATFGYVIESLVSTQGSVFIPSPPSGCSVATQVTYGGTRPDLVLQPTTGGADIAWLDLTASNSADHIFDKDGWNEKISNFAEVTYPSLTPATLSFMVQNKDNQGTLSQKEIKERLEQARLDYLKRKAEWTELGKSFFYSKLKGEIGSSNMVQQLDPTIRQKFIRTKLKTHFNAEITEKMVPSVLRALGVDPASWHYIIGFSESERAGESWLVDHAPNRLDENKMVTEDD